MASDDSELPPIEVQFELQLSDVERGLASLPRARLARWIAWLSMPAVVGVLAWRWHEGRSPGILAVFGGILLLALFLGRDPSKRIAKRVFEALPAEARAVSMHLDIHGISLALNAESTQVDWQRVSRAVESRHSILLFSSRSSAQIIPKRALSSEQLQGLRTLIARYVVARREPWITPEIRRRFVIYAVLIVAFWLVYSHLPLR
jgi:YcxB-like protein